MSGASDPSTPEIYLTRRQLREMRERERLAQLALEGAGASDPDWLDAEGPTAGEVSEIVDLTQAPAEVAEIVDLTPAAAEVIAAELSEPALEPVVIAESDRVIVAPPADENGHEVEDLLTEGLFSEDLHTPSVSSTEVPLPTRAQLRAEAREAGKASARSARIVRSRPASTRPASAPSSTAPAPRKKSRARGIAAQGVTFAAMAFAALMAVSTSLPAEALLSSADVQAASFQALQEHDHEHTQELDIARGTDTITVQRDGYESKSVAEVAAASGIRLEATFTNNPNGTVQWPFAVGVHIGDQFGPRNCRGCSANHGGQDFNPGLGAPIQSIADGVVSVAHDGEGSLGVHMVIDHVINGEKISSVYAHMIHGSMLLNEGDVVKAGQVIGKTGSTGMSTGPHLHFEIRVGGKDGKKVDPLKWLYANVN